MLNEPLDQKLFWTHPMELLGGMGLVELLGDVDLVESRFGPFGDSVSVSARLVHGLRQMYHRLRNPFARTRCNS